MSGFAVPSLSSCRSPFLQVRILLAAIAVVGLVVASAGASAAQDDPEPTPTTPLIITESDADPAIDPGSPIGEIIPGPNSGARPERPGDRGGSLQLGLFALLLTFMAVAAWRVAVSGRKGRQAYAARSRDAASGDSSAAAADPTAGTDTGGDADTGTGVAASGGSEPSPRGD